MPHIAKALDIEITQPKFHAEFDSVSLAQIKTNTNRTLLGRGEFQDVLNAAVQVAKTSHALHDNGGKVVEKHLIGKDTITMVGNSTMKADCQELLKESKKWLDSFDKDGQRLQTGNFEKTAKDNVRDAKIGACEHFAQSAQLALVQLSPELAALKKLQAKVNDGDNSPNTVNALRATDAQILLNAYGKGGAVGGTSEVALAKAPDKSVAYAFKGSAVESDQMGLPKGAGAVREAMAYVACEHVRQKTGLDFGWPETTFAKLSVDGGPPAPGALAEGLKGKVPATDEVLGMNFDPADHGGKSEAEVIADSKSRTDRLPELEVQKLVVCNLLMAQYDMKWGNVFVEKAGDRNSTLKGDEMRARPFDGGAAFPSRDSLMDFGLADTRPGEALLSNCEFEKIGAGASVLNKDLQAAVLRIDPNELRAALTAVVHEAGDFGVAVGGKQKAVRDGALEGIEHAVKSIEGIQKIFKHNLENNVEMSLDTFATMYRDEVYKKDLVPEVKQQEWLGEKARDYGDLQQKNPTLPKPLPDNATPSQMQDAWVNFGRPTQQEALEGIKKLGGSEAMKEHGLNGQLGDFQKASNVLKTFSEKVQAAHPQQQQAVARAPVRV